MSVQKTVLFISILLMFFGSVSCVEVADMEVEKRTVKKGEAETVILDIKMGAGELAIHGGARELMKAAFAYNVNKWKPKMSYEILGTKGIIKIRQGRNSGVPMGSVRNQWDISLSEDVPIGIKIDFGAGKGNLDLRGLLLDSLDIDMGVGDLTVDVRGGRERNLRIYVDGGVGSATFYLPEEVGVRVRVDKGIGSVHARGMHKEKNVYKNETFGKSKTSININVNEGIGSITLKLKNSEYII